MTENTEELSFKEASRELYKLTKWLDAAKYIGDILSATVKAQNEMSQFQQLSNELKAECAGLEDKRESLQADMVKVRENHKAAMDVTERDASERKRSWRKQVEDTKQRSMMAIQKLEKEFIARQLALKEERAELEAGARALRATIQADVDQLERQRKEAEKTITGLKTRLAKAVV